MAYCFVKPHLLAVLTRRTILKNAQKSDFSTIKRRLNVLEARTKKEKEMRDKYPAIKEAYNHYRMTMKLVGSKK